MTPFARFVDGEWKMTAAAGTSMFDTWHWGPGKHSLRVMTTGSNAANQPWRELQVLYWHPGLRQIRLLALNPYSRSVAEGSVKLDGDTLEGTVEMHQVGVRRDLRLRWTFDGPDKFRETLLERVGNADYNVLVEWDNVRLSTVHPQPSIDGPPPELPARYSPIRAFLRQAWVTTTDITVPGVAADGRRLRSTFEWIPYAEALYVRITAVSEEGAERDPAHILDAYIYHHTGAGVLRGLALSRTGGVYEGDVIALEEGVLQLDLKGYEGDQTRSYLVQLDPEAAGTARSRIWSVDGDVRTLIHDAHHRDPGARPE